MKRAASILPLCGAVLLASVASASSMGDGNAGLKALNRGEYGEAVRLFSRAISAGDLAPDDQELAYLNRAKAYIGVGDTAAAVGDLRRAVRLKPSDLEAQQLLQTASSTPPHQTDADEKVVHTQSNIFGDKKDAIYRSHDLNEDCTSIGAVNVEISQPPNHGSISIQKMLFFPSYPSGNVRSVCDSRKAPGTVVFYYPNAGYSGIDEAILTVTNPEGKVTKLEITIAVN
jgi:tetratricopeptide (TPR) repeat protein